MSHVPQRRLHTLVPAIVVCSGQDKGPVYIDMAEKLTELGLVSLIPEELWPPVNATRELATIQRALRRTGQQNAFICADLHKSVLCFTIRSGSQLLLWQVSSNILS